MAEDTKQETTIALILLRLRALEILVYGSAMGILVSFGNRVLETW